MKRFFLFLFSGLLCLTGFSEEENQDLIGIYEHLDEYIPEDLVFLNEAGDTVRIVEIMDKPTVLALVYFNCPGICSPLMDGLAEVIGRTDLVLGKDYQILNISFNAVEGPELARAKKKNYVKQIERPVDESHWIFMTGDSLNIARLTESVGFRFKKEGKDFIHAATIIMLSPGGKITRYLYGTYFLPFDFKMAVVEASKGKSGPTINKFLNYCFSYDPDGKKYVFNITKVAGSLILFFALLFFIFLIISRKKGKTDKQQEKNLSS